MNTIVNGWTLTVNGLEPDKDSIFYQKPKTPAQVEEEKKERNVKLTRIAKGIGLIIRGFGVFFYKFGNGIVKACDNSLAKPENRKILKKMGRLPKNDEHEKKAEEKDGKKEDSKEIVIKIPR